jgi:hypothetical protein
MVYIWLSPTNVVDTIFDTASEYIFTDACICTWRLRQAGEELGLVLGVRTFCVYVATVLIGAWYAQQPGGVSSSSFFSPSLLRREACLGQRRIMPPPLGCWEPASNILQARYAASYLAEYSSSLHADVRCGFVGLHWSVALQERIRYSMLACARRFAWSSPDAVFILSLILCRVLVFFPCSGLSPPLVYSRNFDLFAWNKISTTVFFACIRSLLGPRGKKKLWQLHVHADRDFFPPQNYPACASILPPHAHADVGRSCLRIRLSLNPSINIRILVN